VTHPASGVGASDCSPQVISYPHVLAAVHFGSFGAVETRQSGPDKARSSSGQVCFSAVNMTQEGVVPQDGGCPRRPCRVHLTLCEH
jgi:hypothetical protein